MTHPMRWLALAALEEPALPDPQQLTEFAATRFRDAPPLAASPSSENLLAGTIGDNTFAITLVPQPIPWSQLEGPCATAWYWPAAADTLRQHGSHLLITLIDEGGRSVEKSRRLTEVTASVVATTASRGVFWGPGRLVHPPSPFIEQAVQMKTDDLPLFLWVDFRIEQTGADRTRLYTTGLEALGRFELEAVDFAGPPQQLLEYAYNVAHYSIVEDKSIEEGHTIGLTEEVQATAHRKPSMFDDTLEVICLEFSQAGSDR